MPKREKKSLSIVDISKLAGVSVATVSRVINKNGRFSAETQKRVEEIISENNYVPNLVAKGLKTKKTNFIGVIVPDITNEFFSMVAVEIQNSLRQHGYFALICNTREDISIEREYLDILNGIQMSGLIFISGNTRIENESVRFLPTVYIDRAPEYLGKSLVIESDNYSGGRMAANTLFEAGCRNIACLRYAKNISSHQRRHEGYRYELEARGLSFNASLQFSVDEVSYNAAKTKMLEVMESGLAFDGIFCTTDWLALGTVAALSERGKKVPGDVKVVGFDDILSSRLSSSPLTTIRQQVDIMGRIAADEIIKMINGENIDTSKIEIAVSLVKRQTT
ncbi:MAG: LacI family transcriptional regulator [Clostridiales bacterium]|jgi:LacI family transcriptional regulator|nr:LacI family transcriptional regulator [Clostridiales bacterium]